MNGKRIVTISVHVSDETLGAHILFWSGRLDGADVGVQMMMMQVLKLLINGYSSDAKLHRF